MVITISDTDDFIRALRENEEFQAAARRELLTQDLLELPAVVLDDRMNSDTRGRSYENTEQFVNANAFGEGGLLAARIHSCFPCRLADSAISSSPS